ncbi:MAG TPA: PAS domain S-box protein, partial [Dehalococcoidia bacterium]|nr:PAS domain S-box protein [Dehalococcoidia bacterium]
MAEKAGLVSALGLPLWMGDSIVGVVEFFSKTRRELPSRELTLMAGLANQLAVFLSCLQGQGEGREKSEHLDLALRAANMGSWEWDIEANKVQWSENLEEIHGRLTGSFPGTFEAFQEDIAPEDRERVLTAIQQALSGEPYDIDYRIIRPDGLLRWLAAKGAVIKNRSGRPQKMIGVCMDITERKESEIRLQESEARTRAMLESALDAIITIDGKGQILEFNPAAEAILGFSRDEVTERELAELIIPERFQERHRRALSRLLSSTNGASAEEDEEESLLGRRVEMIVRRADGREIPVELAITRVESQGQPLYTGFLRDISAQKEAAEALKVRLKQNEIVAELGRKALGGMGLEELLDETVRAVAQGLQVEFAKVLQLQPDGKSFLVKAGVGWRDGVVGNAIVEANRDTQAGYTLFSGGPIIEDDLTVETRFRGNPILRNHGVRSGVTVIIESKGHPFGILGAHTAEVRAFSENDVHFLQTVANTLAQAIDRDRFERERNQLLLQELNARRQLEDALKDREVALQLRTSVEERLGLLVEASEELIGSLDVAKVLHVISDLSSRLVSADAVALWQLDNEASKWQIVFSRGFSLNYPKGAVRAAGPVVTEPVFIENLDRDDSIVPEERRRILKEERIRSLMILPLRVRGENTGTLIFYYRTPRRFMEMEMRVGSALANLAASALTASELYEEQRR